MDNVIHRFVKWWKGLPPIGPMEVSDGEVLARISRRWQENGFETFIGWAHQLDCPLTDEELNVVVIAMRLVWFQS